MTEVERLREQVRALEWQRSRMESSTRWFDFHRKRRRTVEFRRGYCSQRERWTILRSEWERMGRPDRVGVRIRVVRAPAGVCDG